MENIRIRISGLLLTIVLVVAGFESGCCGTFGRSSFPEDFLFGTASAAYQYEGAAEEGGKGPSFWDTFTHRHPERIRDKKTGDVAVDFYISSLQDGSLSGGVNKQGVEFYNNLINELISNGLQPVVTIFHWDLPQALDDKYGGFLSDRIVKDYVDFAEGLLQGVWRPVKHWITFNEPWTFCAMGYDLGKLAPAQCTPQEGRQCFRGNSATEAKQNGEIGITLASHWYTPYSPSKADKEATRRSLGFLLGWFMDPLTHGDYPSIMRELVGDRLPKFTKKQSDMIKGSYDFVGLNYYTTYYAFDVPSSNNSASKSCITDSRANSTGVRNGVPIGPQSAPSWIYIYWRGLRELLLYMKSKYNNPVIYITENGLNVALNSSIPLEVALKDDLRVSYHQKHLLYLQRTIRDGVDVRGYFAWSFTDNFEWPSGFIVRFGLYYVSGGLKRYPKNAARWFRRFHTG